MFFKKKKSTPKYETEIPLEDDYDDDDIPEIDLPGSSDLEDDYTIDF